MREFVNILVVVILLSPMMHSVESSFVQNDCKNTDDISDWTVLYYMAGDVSGMHKWTTPLIENLTMVKSSDNVNIVVFHDGFEKDDFSLFYIDENGKRIDLTSDFGWPKEVDSSSLTTLEEFCTQMMNAYTANHYALIPIVSGGTGWQLFCLHDAHDGNVGVSIPAFAASLQRITDETNASIDVLYTSCAMNMVEVVYELRSCVSYVVGTETCLSKQHLVDRFFEPVWDLRNDSTLSPEEFASCSVMRLQPLSFYYEESYFGSLSWLNQFFLRFPFSGLHPVIYHDSVAVVNSSSLDGLAGAITDLSDFLIVHQKDGDLMNVIDESWKQTRKLGKCMSNNKLVREIHRRWHFNATASVRFLDLYHFTKLVKDNTVNHMLSSLCSEVMDAVNETIVSMKKIPGDTQYGLSIYFPPTKYNYNTYPGFGSSLCLYEDLCFSDRTSWDEFIKEYLHV